MELKGYSHKDNDLLGLRKESVLKIARLFRMPAHKLNILDNANYSNVVAMDLSFYKETLLPWILRIEHALKMQLLPYYDQENYYIKFNATSILRGSDKERAEYYREMKNIGAYSVNEIRAFEDMSPLSDKAADYHFYPVNTQPLEKINQGNEAEEEIDEKTKN
jgi:HK97 family phage portal protein